MAEAELSHAANRSPHVAQRLPAEAAPGGLVCAGPVDGLLGMGAKRGGARSDQLPVFRGGPAR